MLKAFIFETLLGIRRTDNFNTKPISYPQCIVLLPTYFPFRINQHTIRQNTFPFCLSIYYSNECFLEGFFKLFLHIAFIYMYTVSKSSSLSFITMSKDHFSHNPFTALCYLTCMHYNKIVFYV